MASRALRRASTVAAAILAATVVAAPAHAAADTGAIGGRLTTSTGAPVADAFVEAYDTDTGNAGYSYTAANGSYRVDDLPAGRYTVSFSAGERPRQYFDNKAEIWDADPVDVTAGVTTTVDEDLSAPGTISGHLVHADGSPVQFAGVGAENEDGQGNSSSTDADGRFAISLFPGVYRVWFTPIDGSTQRQYVPGKVGRTDATPVTVAADQTVEVDDTALAASSVTGRVTTPASEAAADVFVSLDSAAGEPTDRYTRTGPDGRYTLDPVLAGTYIVTFARDESSPTQYHRRTLRREDADPISVAAGAATQVNERLLGTGAVRVTAVDSRTGAPIQRFCVDGCTTTGTLEMTDLTPERHEWVAYTPDGTHFNRTFAATIREGRTTEVALRLGPAAQITTTVVNAATGQPMANVCLTAFKAKRVSLTEGSGTCSNAQGTITMGQLTNGNYRLFATPRSTAYGRQWVGANGGTGDERQAVVVAATIGTVATAPQVRVDAAGTIAGTVTDAETGQPIEGAEVAPFTVHPGSGLVEAVTDDKGRYRIDALGPYAWPLRFDGGGNAQAWTGGATDRYTATPTQVIGGGTATADIALRDGVEVRGTVRLADGGAIEGGYVLVRNAQTGDISGSGEVDDGEFVVRVLPGQRIYFSYDVYAGEQSFSVDRVPGDIVRVPDTGLNTEIVVPTG